MEIEWKLLTKTQRNELLKLLQKLMVFFMEHLATGEKNW